MDKNTKQTEKVQNPPRMTEAQIEQEMNASYYEEGRSIHELHNLVGQYIQLTEDRKTKHGN